MTTFRLEDPRTWRYDAQILAHDVARSRDRSTAVLGGLSAFRPVLTGVRELHELPLGLYGTERANALAEIDKARGSNSIIVADLSSDVTYAETLSNTFGRRVVGVQIVSGAANGENFERLRVPSGVMLKYAVGRSCLIDHLLARFESGDMRLPDDEMARAAYAQLTSLEVEDRPSGRIYACPAGRHDDLAISIAMLAWAARHPHLKEWVRMARPIVRHRTRERVSSSGWT